MEWGIVVSLVVFGLLLLVVEILFVPGTTVVGLLGFIFIITGVALSFRYYGSEVGWLTMGTSAVLAGSALYLSLKGNLWSRFSLKSTSEGKVNAGETDFLSVGQEGKAISTLRPVGKAELGDKIYEVKTLGPYVESGKKIKIIQISSNQIIVEPLS